MDLTKREMDALRKAASSYCGPDVAPKAMASLRAKGLVKRRTSPGGCIHLGWKTTDAGQAILDQQGVAP